MEVSSPTILFANLSSETPDWKVIDDSDLDALEASAQDIFNVFPIAGSPNESQTEDDLIWPVLMQLGWTASLRQQNLSAHGREDVPDGLLFRDAAAKDLANGFAEEWKRYEFGLAVVESKRWGRPLDRRSGRRGEETAPSTQMLRYLRRVDDLTAGELRWGLLTNGARWRLYYQGARSVSEQFFEVDLAVLLDLPGHNDGLFALTEAERHHWFKVFVLIFRREAFVAGTTDPRTFHQRAIEKGQFYEERVAANLSALVFGQVFPELARAIAGAAPEAPLQEVREATLIFLYRLLFILYAEDRDLLPVRNYDDYALREKVRGDVGQRKDRGDVFSASAARYWSAIDDLCRAIDQGDTSIGLPPYNGGLFDQQRVPLLANIRIGDAVMADVIDALSFEQTPHGRRYINYRDLGVQQLGSIYERLLEHEIVRDGGEIAVPPEYLRTEGIGQLLHARRFGRPDHQRDDRAAGPIAYRRFQYKEIRTRHKPSARRPQDGPIEAGRSGREVARTKESATPPWVQGHFLVNLVDHLADRVITALAEAEASMDDYISPLTERIDTIRNTIIDNAEQRGWTINTEQLNDRHIVQRMVLKRCVYGVDKNPMAVELAKVALWLHTFTVGAPLSFLDHHLRCGDSLFGSWVRNGIDKASEQGGPLFLKGPLKRATRAAAPMQIIEELTDAEIAEAHRSAEVFAEIEEMTTPLNSFLSLVQAFDWLNIRDRNDKGALYAYFTGIFGDPIDIASGKIEVLTEGRDGERFAGLLDEARQLLADERFFNWQVAFPGVWSEWENAGLNGGFDAVIGNPPWDRMKLQQVEWFAARRREIALASRAADRKRMIADLEKDGDPLARDFAEASERAMAAVRIARAMTIVKSDGMVGLLTPSGIASDKTASRFFKGVATEGRLRALYDFENRRTRYDAPPFFPDVDSRFKFCAFVASPAPAARPANCAFFLQDVSELDDPDRCFPLTAGAFARVNPNTGTAPIFRTRRDAELTTAIYSRMPVLVNRSSGEVVKAWPVKYSTRMFDMTNGSGLFRTRAELEEQEGAYPVGGNRFASPSGDWVPLYVGKNDPGSSTTAPPSVDREREEPAPARAARSGDISAEPERLIRTSSQPRNTGCCGQRDVSFPNGLDWT